MKIEPIQKKTEPALPKKKKFSSCPLFLICNFNFIKNIGNLIIQAIKETKENIRYCRRKYSYNKKLTLYPSATFFFKKKISGGREKNIFYDFGGKEEVDDPVELRLSAAAFNPVAFRMIQQNSLYFFFKVNTWATIRGGGLEKWSSP